MTPFMVRPHWTTIVRILGAAVWTAGLSANILRNATTRWAFWAGTGLAAASAAWALYKSVSSLRRDRLVADTPLVKIRSAAQGYVKVWGRATPGHEEPTRSPLSSRPCVWWSYSVEERIDDGRSVRWDRIESASSVAPFTLADEDGECLVGVVNAEITPTVHDVWYGDSPHPRGPPGAGGSWLERSNFRFTERLLLAGDRLSVTGELRSQSELDSTDAAAELLRSWKRDQASLLARFDHNHDGRIDSAEWEGARQTAAAEARARMLRAPVARISVIGQPTHGEPFLIAPMDSDGMVRREMWRAWAYLGMGVICVALCAVALQRALASGMPR